MAEWLFVDTWGWLALHDKREERHAEVTSYVKAVRAREGRLLSSDFVLDETVTLLFKRLASEPAKAAVKLLREMVQRGQLRLERIGPDRFEKTMELRMKLADKPAISFTDLSSVVVMEELGIGKIITADSHFQQVGKGFQIVPG